MKILAASDIHLGRPGWSPEPERLILRIKEDIRRHRPDVLLLGGDLIEPGERPLEEVLGAFEDIPLAKLWVVGNDDLEALQGPLSGYAEEAQKLAEPFGFHVLDHAPWSHQEYRVIGNLGWFDGSLWRAYEPEPVWSKEEVTEQAEAWLQDTFGPRADLTNAELFVHCQQTLIHHHCQACEEPHVRVVRMTHTVPSRKMVLYGESAKHDYMNHFMGWEDGHSLNYLSQFRVALQLCGHTHRQQVLLGKRRPPLINVSGLGQPRLLEV